LSFTEYHQYEDTDFALKAYYVAERVEYIPFVVYVYREHLSTTSRPDDPLKMFDQVLLLGRVLDQYYSIGDTIYGRVLKEYVINEISQVGKRIARMSVINRWGYYKLVKRTSLRWARRVTSFRNYCRLKYGVAI